MPLAVAQQALPAVSGAPAEVVIERRGIERLRAERPGGSPGELDGSTRSGPPDTGAGGEGEGLVVVGIRARGLEFEPGNQPQGISLEPVGVQRKDLFDTQLQVEGVLFPVSRAIELPR